MAAEAGALRQHPPTLRTPANALRWGKGEESGNKKKKIRGNSGPAPMHSLILTYIVFFFPPPTRPLFASGRQPIPSCRQSDASELSIVVEPTVESGSAGDRPRGDSDGEATVGNKQLMD